jgi:hypothetical protein
LAKNVSEVSATFLKVRRLGILTLARHTDPCRSTTKGNSRVRHKIENLYGSIAFIGVGSEEALRMGSCTNQSSFARLQVALP